MWQVYSQGPSEQKPFKILGENGAWAYPATAQIFGVPAIISGTGKATNFKFCTHILSIDRNKRPLQISGKVARCVVGTLETVQGTHVLGASRGLLCDSSAVLFAIGYCLTPYVDEKMPFVLIRVVHSLSDLLYSNFYRAMLAQSAVMRQ